MTLDEIITLARSYLLYDTAQSFRWPDSILTTYANEAERETCRRADLLIDKTTTDDNATAVRSIVAVGNLTNKAWTIANQPDVARQLVITVVDTTTSITAGTVTIIGTASDTTALTEAVDCSAGAGTYTTTNAFKTITSITTTVFATLGGAGDETFKVHCGTEKPICEINLMVGVSTYAISQKVIRTISMSLESTGLPILKKTESWLDEFYPDWRLSTCTGSPIYYTEEKGVITFVPIPTETDTVNMVVSRLPLVDMAEATKTVDTPEISSEYHFDMIDWICVLAYSKQDDEVEDSGKKAYHDERFTQKFGRRPSAKDEMTRRRMPRNLTARPKRFGFNN